MAKLIANLLLFQLGWFTCVIGGSRWALAFIALLLPLHSFWLMQSRREWWLLLAVLILGCAWDSAITSLGVLLFENPLRPLPIPVWLLCLWLLFATTLNHSLAWLQNRLWLAALLGAVFGPLSYLAGTNISSAQLAQPLWQSLAILSLGWAVIMPLVASLSRRLLKPEVAEVALCGRV